MVGNVGNVAVARHWQPPLSGEYKMRRMPQRRPPRSFWQLRTMLWRPDPHPDANLRASQMSLADFNRLIYRVDAAEGDTQEDKDYEVCLAALAGRYFDHDRGIERRIFLNPREGGGMPPPSAAYIDCDEHHYRVHRDYDSMFGMTKRLPYSRSLHVFPVASFRDTLTKRVHLTYPIIRDGVSEILLCAAVIGMTTGAMEQRTTFVELSKILFTIRVVARLSPKSFFAPHTDTS